MSEIMTAANSKMLTVADYEARIHLYKEQIGIGYIGIGRTLNEAKEAGVVPAGQWEAWVQDVTGLTVRQAQRCMQAAREIKDGSALARLEMSKAMRLLSSGLDEDQREELARKTADNDLTVKALEDEIRKLRTGFNHAVSQAKDWEKRARESFDEGRKSAERASQIDGNLQLVQKDEEIRKLRQDVLKAQAARENMERSMNLETSKSADLALKVDEMRGQLHEAVQARKYAEEQLKKRAGADQEQYYIGRNAGLAEAETRRLAEAEDHRQAMERMQETINGQQDRLDAQQHELNELRRKDRQARMDAARSFSGGSIAGAQEDKLSRAIMDFLQMAGKYGPDMLRNDAALPGQLAALETWVGLVRMQMGIPVEGVVA